MYDRDADLLGAAAADMVDRSADGAPVTVRTRHHDVSLLTAADLAGAALVTASALLDLLTIEDVERIATACAGAGCAALLTLPVGGRVALSPADPFDPDVEAAYNAHQRREVGGSRLLGPDAAAATVDAFAERGVASTVRQSPWRIGPDQPDLAAQWFAGWVDAACEQRPELADPAVAYRRRRLAELAAGRLEIVVEHDDLLAGGE
jgi:hypothetical protein